ncbi:jg25379, partial [Pararge aegeria aegeria]
VSAGVTTVPLLLMHGWPGSVREFYEAIPLLTKKAEGYDFVFEVIVPSLPGYGFSDILEEVAFQRYHRESLLFNIV